MAFMARVSPQHDCPLGYRNHVQGGGARDLTEIGLSNAVCMPESKKCKWHGTLAFARQSLGFHRPRMTNPLIKLNENVA